jgi:hypothetical protein
MIYFTKNGVRLTEEGWNACSPYVDTKPEHSSIVVSFRDGVNVTVTEDFINHCSDMFKHVREQQNEQLRERNNPKPFRFPFVTRVQSETLHEIHRMGDRRAEDCHTVTIRALLRKGLITLVPRLYFGPREERYKLSQVGVKWVAANPKT